MQAGRLAEAIEAGLEGFADAVGRGAWAIPDLAGSAGVVEQTLLESWRSAYQEGEVWENLCAGERCLEIFLGEVRQLSDRFEHYYHEAMTYPALNLLGPSKAKRVLVLGGGDGGIATLALKYDSVEHVQLVEIDPKVTETSKTWFPDVAAGLSDPRCKLVHEDALSWVRAQTAQQGERFDLIVIDFTDEPIADFWSTAFFDSVKQLLSPDGLLVQNVGTMILPKDVDRLFRFHLEAFKTTYPLSTTIPDYASPYLLALSSDAPLDPWAVDWSFWERQGILPTYYSRELHGELFVAPADMLRFLGARVAWEPERPSPLPRAKAEPASSKLMAHHAPDSEKRGVLHSQSTAHNQLVVSREGDSLCREGRGEACRSLAQNRERTLSRLTVYRSEAMVLPALNLLGERARRVLVLGGGTGELAALALKFPAVERVVVVEIDAALADVVRQWFPLHAAAVFDDPRVELVVADALQWLRGERGAFDAVFVNLANQPWRNASRSTRVPRTGDFVSRLHGLLEAHGILVQDIGSVAAPSEAAGMVDLHRQAFAAGGSVWPMSYASLDGDIEDGEELDGRLRRPPWLLVLSSRAYLDPCAVDWSLWKTAGMETSYYHPSLHRGLFVLPAELQRLMSAPPPRSRDREAQAALAPLGSADAGVDATAADTGALVFTFTMEARECNEPALNSRSGAEDLLLQMAEIGGLTPIGNVSFQFEPQGVTSLLLVSESHLSIHTWPEFSYAALDVCSCKEITPQAGEAMLEAIRASLGCRNVTGEVSLRGFDVATPDAALSQAETSAASGRTEL